ncbi:hypothetical protein FRC03_000561 [Tulasnella sp. 419]|nr:hypothetical protein FRC02_002410 [Tulasnella sp. 418]KAG8965386.1 hypothetical protein FRC03_000561 [Tulasnella sp. 419]
MGLLYTIGCALFATIGSFIFGYDLGVIASVLTFPSFKNHFNNPGADIEGAIVSVLPGGAFFGAVASGYLADPLGRKRTIQVGALIGVLGCALQTGGLNNGMLIAGRVIAGISVGLLSMIGPLYQAEIAPPKHRGFIVGLAQQMIGIGFISANWVGYGSQFLDGNVQWRLPLGIQIVPAGLLFLGAFFLPYSPRWLITKGRYDEALAVVRKLHGNDANEEWIQSEFQQMKEQILYEQEQESSDVRELWSTKPMLNYGPRIYESLGVAGNKLLLVNSIYGVIGPITNFFFITLLLDRIGRVKPLIFGSVGICVVLSIECALNAQFPADDPNGVNLAAQRGAVAMFFLSSIIFSLSYGPVSWVYVSEVFPMRVRSQGNALATACNWIFNVIWAQVAPKALKSSGWKFYLLYVVLNIVSATLVILFFPETKGKTLEEMDEVFGDQKIAHEGVGGSDSNSVEKGERPVRREVMPTKSYVIGH